MDKFVDSLNRITADVKSAMLSGNAFLAGMYEAELTDMLAQAFANSDVIGDGDAYPSNPCSDRNN